MNSHRSTAAHRQAPPQNAERRKHVGKWTFQVAMGGNAKIREEFKKHGITGKRKDTGGQRVDYFSKT